MLRLVSPIIDNFLYAYCCEIYFLNGFHAAVLTESLNHVAYYETEFTKHYKNACALELNFFM